MKLAVPGASNKQLDKAIEYIMKGRFVYSRFRDTLGMRLTFDNLAYVYRLQHKYVQAKWFYIESNSASRDLKDTLGIIQSLIKLASVKTDIKDYEMAQRDLTDAFQLAKTRPGIDQQIAVESGLAEFYSRKGDSKKAAAALNRIVFLKDSVSKVVDAQKQALLKKQQDELSLIKQKQQLLQTEEDRMAALIRQKKGITILLTSITGILVLILLAYMRKRKRKAGK
jgi:tetratricopeptide (TPR) repeat protein